MLADPEKTPTAVYNTLADAVTDLTSADKVQNSAEVVRVALAHHAEREGGDDAGR